MKNLLYLALLAAAYLLGKQDAKSAIQQADLDFCKAARERRLDGWMSFWAPDATLMAPGQPPLKDPEKLRAHYAKSFADPNFSIDWRPVIADAAQSGDLGYTIGTAEIHFTGKDGKIETRPGKYLTVWKKQKDGSWKVVADLGN